MLQPVLTRWRGQSITIKLALSQATLVILIVLVALTAYAALTAVRRQADAQEVSMEIQRLVLEMVTGLQHARQSSSNFFLRWPTIGFGSAQENYLEGNEQRIAEVIARSTRLQELIATSDVSAALRENDVNLNFYLSAADRYAATVTETVALVTQLAASETGAQARLGQMSAALYEALRSANDPALLLAFREMQALEKDYLVTRQRPFMQSAFNAIGPLREAISESPRLPAATKEQTLASLDTYRSIADEVLRLDVDIRNKFDEFDQQSNAVDPISEELVTLALVEVDLARNRIAQTSQLAVTVLALAVVIAMIAAALIARLQHASITRRVVALKGTASELQKGNLKARAVVDSVDELGQLGETFNTMSDQLRALVEHLEEKVTERTAELTEANRIISKHRDRMQEELNVGHEIQMSMIPLTFPPFPERDDFTIHATLQPAREVGGDFYDFFFVGEDRFCVCIGDVAGKGVPSALFMAVTKTLIKSRAVDEWSTAKILSHVNSELSHNNKESMFVTVFLAILDVSTGEFVYSNAGHNPPYVRRREGGLDRLGERHGPVLGAVGNLNYGENRERLQPGDLLFLYTDGLTEAMDGGENLYSETRLATWLRTSAGGTVEEIINAAVADVKAFEAGAAQADDLTMMALTFQGSAEQPTTMRLELLNQLPEVERLNVTFAEFAVARSVPKRVISQFRLVFDELLTNIISYAYTDEAEHRIRAEVRWSTDKIVATITDDGKPFNPFKHGTPPIEASIDERKLGGLGIHLVRNVMDEVRYERAGDRNVVGVAKYLDTSAAESA